VIIIKCCGEAPTAWVCECRAPSFCGCDVEKTECSVCGRIVYGSDAEDIKRWNDGGNDDE